MQLAVISCIAKDYKKIELEDLKKELESNNDIQAIVGVNEKEENTTLIAKGNNRIDLKNLFMPVSYAAEEQDYNYAKVTYKSGRVYFVALKNMGDIVVGSIYTNEQIEGGTTEDETIEEIPNLTQAEVIYKKSTTNWTNKNVTTTIELNTEQNITGYETEYTKFAEGEEVTSEKLENATWTEYVESGIVSEQNETIYTRLYNGNNVTSYTSAQIANIDKEDPTISTELSSSNITSSGFTLNVGVTDANSGLGKIVWKYKLSTDADYTEVERVYTELNGINAGETTATKTEIITGITGGKTYKAYAEVYDVAGNKTTSEEINIDMTAGLYDANGVMLASWEESGISVEINYGRGSDETNYYETTTTSPYYVITNKYPKTKRIVIPDSVTSIGQCVFYKCTTLTSVGPVGSGASVEIPNSVTSIGYCTFDGCTSLTSVEIPYGITVIEDSMFWGCTELNTVIIPDSVTEIYDYAFGSCTSLTSIGPVGSGASVEIPNSVTGLPFEAFCNCTGLTNVIIPNNITYIGDSAFSGCTNLTSLELGNGVTDIGSDAFYNCSKLSNVTIPNGVVKIDIGTFSNCTSLTNVTIPDSVTEIGYYAFSKCTNLTSVYIPSSVTTIEAWNIDEATFYGCSPTLKIYCGASAAPSGWSSKWNYYDSSNKLSTTYGVTREVYELTYKQ